MPAGRPTELTAQVLADVRKMLPVVLYIETVADFIGVSRMTFHRWLKRGKKEEKRLRKPRTKPLASEAIYLEFCDAVKKGIAEGEAHSLNVIHQAAKAGTWTAGAWLLERRHPEKWGSDRTAIRELQQMVKEIVASRPQDAKADTKAKK